MQGLARTENEEQLGVSHLALLVTPLQATRETMQTQLDFWRWSSGTQVEEGAGNASTAWEKSCHPCFW